MKKKKTRMILQKICSVLMCILIFLTTYLSLLKPVSTFDIDTAEKEPGLSLETAEEVIEGSEKEENSDPESDGSFIAEKNSEEEPILSLEDENKEATQEKIENEENEVLTFYDDSTDVIVAVEAPYGAFKQGTQMSVRAVEESEVLDAVNQALDGGSIADEVLAVDITFIYNDEEVEPKLPIKVSLTSRIIEEAEDLQVVHIDSEGAGSLVEQADEESKDDEIIFEADSFSTYVVVSTKTVVHYVTADGTSYRITVTFDDNEKLYGNESLFVDEIAFDSEEYLSYYARSADALKLGENEEIIEARFFDIKPLRDGTAFEPEYPAEVKIEYDDTIGLSEEGLLNIVHFGSEGTEVINDYSINEEQNELIYVQNGFSVTGTVVARNDITAGEYVVYTQTNGRYYAISHYSEGRDQDIVYGVEISGSTVTGDTISSDSYGSSIVWTVTPVTVGGTRHYTLSYEEDGKTYYLRSYGGLMVGADSDIDEAGYREAGRYQWNYDSSRHLRNYHGRNNNDYYLRYSASAGGFKERDNYNQGVFYFARVSNYTPDVVTPPTIHFVDESGNELPLTNGRNWQSDSTTSPAFLIYDIEGYDYVKTTLGTVSGDEIRPLIRRFAGQWQYTASTDQATSISWSGFPDTANDVYVVYRESTEPVTGGTPKIKESGSTEEPVDPVINKSSVSNGDGTNTISLSITADTSPLEVEKLADVIVIFDTSTSMRRYMGTSTTTYNDNNTPASQCDPETRLYIAANAVNGLADMLIGDNTEFKDSAGNKLIRMSLISFNRNAALKQDFTDNYSTYSRAVNALTTDAGTNWEAALDLANHMSVDPERATFVIFVTDGNPSYRTSRGNLLTLDGYPETIDDAHLDVNTANQYYFYRVLNYFGALDENDIRNFNTAVTEAKSIVDHNKNYYAIGIGNAAGVSKLQDLTTGAYSGNRSIGQERTMTAENEDELRNAFRDITASIVALLGWGDINMTDGITSLANTVEKSGLLNVDGNFEYWKAPAPQGWGDMSKEERKAFLEAYKPADSAFASWDPASENCNEAIYDAASGSVKWDMGHSFVPESGCTYKVSFRVWPSQEAYDILANLKNGAVTYDSLTEAQKAQIVDLGGGNYSLKTNDKDPSTTYKAARKTGDGVTTSGDTKTLKFNDVDPMALVPEKMTVKKEWDYSINDSHAADALKFRLLVDGKYYQNDGTFAESSETAKVLDISEKERTVDGVVIPAWSNSINIAPGIVIFENGTAEVYETGHKYQLEEFGITLDGEDASQFAGSYEFTTQTVRPMVLTDANNGIHAQLIYLILSDADNPVPEKAATYTIGNDTYFVEDRYNSTVVGTNHRKAELDITKLINNNSKKPDAELLSETFTYRITLNVPADADLSLITGYEYVQRADPNFTLHGYQEGDSPLPGDEKRFRGMIFRQGTFKYGTQSIGDAFTDVEGGRKTLTLDATLLYNEVLRLTNIPTGTVYTIEEIYANRKRANLTSDAEAVPDDVPGNLEEQGYTVTQILSSATEKTIDLQNNRITGTISDPDKRYYNQFTNTLGNVADVEITGTKHLEGYEWTGERYYFNLKGGENAPLPIIGAYGRTRFYLSDVSGSADKTYSFGRIRFTEAGTYVYTVSEDNAGTIKKVNDRDVQFGNEEKITIKIAEDEDGKLYVASVTGNENVTWDKEKNIANVTITNVSIIKTVGVKLKKVNENNELLGGSKFSLSRYVDNAWALVSGKDELAPGSTAQANPVDLGELETGRYKLTETKAPDGYVILSKDTYFEVQSSQDSVRVVLTDADGKESTSTDPAFITQASDGTYLITVKNTPGAALPMTGGTGRMPYYLGGAMLIAISLLLKKRTS